MRLKLFVHQHSIDLKQVIFSSYTFFISGDKSASPLDQHKFYVFCNNVFLQVKAIASD
jgi:hypothetical protein